MSETNDQRPTLRTLAQSTGLGVSTVSQALRNNPEIAEETRKRVQLAAKQAGYRPNRAGVRLRTGKSNVIALVLNVQDGGTGFFSNIIYGISDSLVGTSYHLVVTPYSLSDPMEPVRYIVETNSADGVILSRTQPDDPRIRYLLENQLPFATHGRTDMGLEHAYFDYDNEAFASQAVKMLASKKRRNIVLISPPNNLTYHQHTLTGFHTQVIASKVSGRLLLNCDTDSSLSATIDAVALLCNSGPKPDGFVCTTSSVALAVCRAMELGGYQLGQDFDIVAKPMPDQVRMMRPDIIAVDEDFRRAGQELGRMVMARINGVLPGDLQVLDRPS